MSTIVTTDIRGKTAAVPAQRVGADGTRPITAILAAHRSRRLCHRRDHTRPRPAQRAALRVRRRDAQHVPPAIRRRTTKLYFSRVGLSEAPLAGEAGETECGRPKRY
ncbi:hypothetical protein [Streptomyces sp. NPDC055287]